MVDSPNSYSFNKAADVTSLNSVSLTNFPSFIRLEKTGDSTGTGVAGLDTQASIDGREDIGFFDENDNSLTYYWTTFDTANDVYEAWVLVDITRDGGQEIIVGYGDGSTDDSSTESDVWDNASNIAARYSKNESSGSILDSTSNNNDGTAVNFDGDEYGASGVFGTSINYDGSNDEVELPNNSPIDSSLGNDYTVIAWAYPEGNSSASNPGVIWKGPYNDNSNGALQIEYREDSSERSVRYLFYNDSGNRGFFDSPQDSMPLNTWTMAAIRLDSSNGRSIILNGDEQTVTGENGIGASDTTQGYSGSDWEIGRKGNSSGSNEAWFDGSIEEVQIISDSVSNDYLQTHYDMSSEGGYSLYSWNSSTSTATRVSLSESFSVSEVRNELQELFRAFSEGIVLNEVESVLISKSITEEHGINGVTSFKADYFRTYQENFNIDADTKKKIKRTLQEAAGISENYSDNTGFIVGTVDLDGTQIENANVYVVKAGVGSFQGSDSTDSNGFYEIGKVTDQDRYLVAVDFESGGTDYGKQKSIEVDFN